MKFIDLTEQKVILLSIFRHFDLFCRQNNIGYFLCGGTLLGAIRHKGFIPWDDDIDIMMLREDYERFIKLYHENDQSDFHVYTHRINHKYPYPYAKLDYCNTIFKEEIVGAIDIGVNIDIFPIDKVPDSFLSRKMLIIISSTLIKILTLKRLPVKKRRGITKNLYLFFSHFIFSPLSFQFLVKLLDKNALRYRNRQTNHKGVVVWGCGMREIMPADCYEKVIHAKFEDIECFLPQKYDVYLKSLFGDYMKLPPIEKRITHHHNMVYWREL